MKLSNQDADLFFKLMWSLQFYVNQHLALLPEISNVDEYSKLPQESKILVRNALYDNIGLIDSYIEKNNQEFTTEELDIIRSWKQFIRGEFFIERFLKKYTIFIRNESVYGVYALHDPLEEIFLYVPPPQYVKAVLLPFKGKLIYDGLLHLHNLYFGSGIRSELKETYMTAKQNGRIIESFDSKKQFIPQDKQKKSTLDWRPAIDEITQEITKLRSSAGSPPIQSPAFSLAKASIEFVKTAVHTPDNIEDLWKALKKVERAIRKVETTLYRAE
ncbi:MAG: hypothetical protein MUO76_10790 [Anaerolineaceae bacterium]|nr:hypothetical protein [Anaerolineaceae bacterium]